MAHIKVIGAGLAGCEAAHQAARLGVDVTLYEMKPKKKTAAHKSDGFAELICSNSLRSFSKDNAVGLMKYEMKELSSLIMEAAEKTQVPAGSALAVDREAFSAYITEKIKSNPKITVVEEEVTVINDDCPTIIATGPLTSDKLSEYISDKYAHGYLHFFDAVAPIVNASSINTDIAFLASRYGKGSACYYNCPMTKEQYDLFYKELISAQEAKLHDFDSESQKDVTVFEGCMPIETMAKRGYETLLYGPLKPVGLPLPSSGKEAYAVVQLRMENVEGTMYNLVGFQTHLTFSEQKRVFRLIPGLENAEFYRYGVMHRNTYLNSPELLCRDYSLKENGNIYFAGQMTGVEGYVESAGSGLVAGICAAFKAQKKDTPLFPDRTELGAMAAYVANGTLGAFVPMNANFGIMPPLGYKVKGGKSARNAEYFNRSMNELAQFKEKYSL